MATGIYNPFAFGKFFDYLDLSNLPARPDNKHFVLFSLKRTLERFAHFPIDTSPDDDSQFPKKPRLLLVTVDAKSGDAVAFDSAIISKSNTMMMKTPYLMNWVLRLSMPLASGTFPDFFDYPKFKVESNGMKREEERIFWDGGFRSNTPLRVM